jgi:DNA-binding transcriptional MerR regulator
MRIAELAEASGFPASTLRFYEKAGLLPAERDPNGYRRFAPEAVDRLAFIATAKRLGLPLEEIAEVVEIWADQACHSVRDDLRPRLAQRLAAARRQAVQAKAFAERLEEAVRRLETLPDLDSRCEPDCCDLVAGPSTDAAGDTSGDTSPDRWRTAPVACDLTAESRTDRLAAWHRLLAAAAPIREPIPDGLRLTVPAAHTSPLVELAVAEQRCCPFLDFRFHLDGPVTHLEVRASTAGLQTLSELFA